MLVNLKGKTIEIHRFHIFVCVVTILKLVLMGLFSSDYQNTMFIPFTKWFVLNMQNPYKYFYEIGQLNAFPYPTIMLLIESVSALVIQVFHVSSVFMINIIYKLPSLVFDFLGLYFLVRMFPERRRYAAILYFASPIILYSVYMHGQLDLIPTVLLLGAVYYLSSKNKKRFILGGILLIAALLSKLHILAAVPVIFLYMYKREGLGKTIFFHIIVLGAVLLGMLPFFSDGFYRIVLFNSEQSVLTEVAINFANVKLYIPVVAVLTIYLIAFSINLINRELFISLCGIVFAIFLAFCPPMPGWYVWIVPYVTLFFINIDEDKYKNIIIYIVLNIFYLIYFVFLHTRGYVDLYFLEQDLSVMKFQNETLANMLFTLLAGTLAYIIFYMYRLGVISNSLYKRRNLPFTIGIAGDSGAGKSTFIGVIASSLGKHNLLFIEGDGDHKWERGEKHWEEFTHLNPKANYLYRQAADLKQLRMGSSVKRVEYDHDTGTFTLAKKIKPQKYIILCGLHSLYLPQTRKNIDLKIYMDVDETLRRFWKIQRDVAHRGYSKEKIIEQIEARVPDAIKYIHPQSEYADMIIQYYDKTLTDCMEDNHHVKMSVRITFSASIDIEPLINELVRYGISISYDYSEDLQKQIVDIDADDLESAVIPIEDIAQKIVPQLDEITRESLDEENGKNGILKLFLLLLISNKMQGEI